MIAAPSGFFGDILDLLVTQLAERCFFRTNATAISTSRTRWEPPTTTSLEGGRVIEPRIGP